MTPEDETYTAGAPSSDDVFAGTEATTSAPEPVKPRRRKGLIIGGIVTGAVVLAGAGVGAAYATHYADKALPGTVVAGQSVSGQTRDEVKALLDSGIQNATLTVNVDGTEHKATLADLGYSLDTEAMLDKAFESNATWSSRIVNIASPAEVEATVATDETKLHDYAKKLVAEYGEPTKDASIAYDEASETFVPSPGVVGKTVDEKPLVEAAGKLADTLEPQSVDLKVVDAPPAVTDEMAANAASQASALLQPVVFIKGKDANSFADPTKAEKATWIGITPDNGGTAVLDDAKIKAWVKKAAEQTGAPVENGIKNVDAQGNELTVAKEGVAGYTANNVDQVAADLTAAVKSGAEYDGEFTYDRTPEPTYETRQALPNAKDLAYPAAEGEHWLEVDLTEINTSLWIGDQEIATYPVVPGDPRAPTPEGRFNVLWKVADETMRGENFGGGTYEVSNVPWATYFTPEGHAFHGAWWVSSFGWSGYGGSHGCLNMPEEGAKAVYDHAPVGTPVVIHS